MKKTFLSLLSVSTLFMGAAQAELLMYEGFNGYTAGTIHGQSSTTADGLQGDWTVTNTLPAGGLASSQIQSTGLTFGTNFNTTGGSLISTARKPTKCISR